MRKTDKPKFTGNNRIVPQFHLQYLTDLGITKILKLNYILAS